MAVIKIRRGTTQQWTTSNRVLQVGELGLDTTLNKLKAGNGSTAWLSLPFLQADADITELAQDAVATALANGTHSNITVTYDDATNKISLATGPDVITQTSLSNTLTNATTGYVPIGDVGNADGVASLDSNGFIPDSEIPAAIARDSELSSHTSATTNVHGISDTSALATKAYADNAASTAASALVASAPSTLNTLNELATALGNDASFSTTISTALGNKEPLLPSQSGNSGKFLTTNGTEKSWATITQPSAATRTTFGTVLGYTDVSTTNNNVAIGQNSGPITPSPSNVSNVSIGVYANGSITNGNSNTGVGTSSFAQNPSGIGNTGVGGWSGYNNVSGSYNVFLGHYAGTGSESGSNNIIIGNQASASSASISNQITLGNSSITSFRIPGLAIDWTASSMPALQNVSFNPQPSNYILTTSDSGKLIEMSGGGTLTITDSSAFPVGFTCDVLQTTTSQVTIAGTSFTPNSTPGLKLRTQWSSATLIKRGLNSWVVLGDLSA